MKLTDDQIQSIMQKQICCKSILVDFNKIDEAIITHQKDGWELIKNTEVNGRAKLTFKK